MVRNCAVVAFVSFNGSFVRFAISGVAVAVVVAAGRTVAGATTAVLVVVARARVGAGLAAASPETRKVVERGVVLLVVAILNPFFKCCRKFG